MAQIPSFLVIGAGKSGTSSLHEYLRQHPMISLPRRKETHFFVCDRESSHPMTQYEGRKLENTIDNLADYLAEFEFKENATVFGEVCPTYLFYPYAAENIKRYIPDPKIICILRNPVDRLYSNYNFHEEDNSLEDFLQLTNDLPAIPSGETNFRRWILEGFYSTLLRRYYAIFPEEKIKIYLFDELVENPDLLMKDILIFLGLPEFQFNTALKFNTSGKIRFKWLKREIKKSRLTAKLRNSLPIPLYQNLRNLAEKVFFKKADKMPISTRRKLQDHYRGDILELQQLIKRDLSHWLN